MKDSVLTRFLRLAPDLDAIAGLAGAGKIYWGAMAHRGGSEPDAARRLLMRRLCPLFKAMFGRPATVSVRFVHEHRGHFPDGPAILWFRAFFRRIPTLLEGASEDAGSLALAHIARDALDSPRDDVIAGWIRGYAAEQGG